MPKTEIGRIVRYRLTKQDAETVNARRTDAGRYPNNRNPAMARHSGNSVSAGEELPMMIVAVWGAKCVNGKVFLDGDDTLWVTSVNLADDENDGPGFWSWPSRGKD